MKVVIITLAAFLQTCSVHVQAFSAIPSTSVAKLLSENKAQVDELEQIAFHYSDEAPQDDIFYLRYCLNNNKDKEKDEIIDQLKSNLDWRRNEGKYICDAAASAITLAQSSSEDEGTSAWNNAPVRDSAPHADIINKYITQNQCLTTTINTGDLCYCIRAGKIDDNALMDEVTLDQMTDFFLYCKEVNALVANMRSVQTDQLVTVLTANDLQGVKLIGGSKAFRKALSAASTKANDLYPNLSGPTFLLNLPKVLGALVKLFTPLFPDEVRKRLKFKAGPLKDVDNLVDIAKDAEKRAVFLAQVDDCLNE